LSLPIAAPATPPLRLLRLHFGAALFWWLTGALGLVAAAGRLASGAFLDPLLLGLTHCFTLGWITIAIVGTLYQLFPALLGVGLRNLALAHWTWAGFVAGTAVLAGSLALWYPPGLIAGWLILFAAVFAQSWNVLAQRRRAVRNRVVGWYFNLAHQALGFAMLAALVRIGDGFGWWVTPRLGLLAAHFHMAALGFATLTAVGAGSRMIPMFLGAGRQPDWPLAWIWRLTAAGLIAFSIGTVASIRMLTWAGSGLMAGAVALFLFLAATWFQSRAARKLDHATAHLAAAFAWLGLALVTGFLVLGLRAPRLPLLYGLIVLLGWLSHLIAGVLYRIIPVLTWNHRYARLAGAPGTPALADLSRPAYGWASLVLLNAGLALLLAGIAGGSIVLTRAGAVGYAAGTVVVAAHHYRLFRL
jgi:hypothetical protein